MLELQVKGMDFFDESVEEYIEVKDQCLVLEHSLISLYKWEQKWEIYFMDNQNITNEQFIDYVRCMTINKVDPLIYQSERYQSIHEPKNDCDYIYKNCRTAKSEQIYDS